MDMGKRGKTGFENGNQNGGRHRIAAAVDMSREMFVCWGNTSRRKTIQSRNRQTNSLGDLGPICLLLREQHLSACIVHVVKKKPSWESNDTSPHFHFFVPFLRNTVFGYGKNAIFGKHAKRGKRRPAIRRNGGARTTLKKSRSAKLIWEIGGFMRQKM